MLGQAGDCHEGAGRSGPLLGHLHPGLRHGLLRAQVQIKATPLTAGLTTSAGDPGLGGTEPSVDVDPNAQGHRRRGWPSSQAPWHRHWCAQLSRPTGGPRSTAEDARAACPQHMGQAPHSHPPRGTRGCRLGPALGAVGPFQPGSCGQDLQPKVPKDPAHRAAVLPS